MGLLSRVKLIESSLTEFIFIVCISSSKTNFVSLGSFSRIVVPILILSSESGLVDKMKNRNIIIPIIIIRNGIMINNQILLFDLFFGIRELGSSRFVFSE